MENLGVSFSRKSRSPQQIVRYKNFMQNRLANESQNKPNQTKAKADCVEMGFSPKANEKKKNPSEFFFSKRPSTAVSCAQKTEFVERDRNFNIQTSKSFFSEPKEAGRERRRSFSHSKERQQSCYKAKLKTVSNQRNSYTEDLESISLLSKAVFEQGQIIELFSVAREELLKKMAEKINAEGKRQERGEELRYSSKDKSLPSCPNFENSYTGTLEEIFQAWVHLFYFIINLRINLVRMLNCVDSETWIPKGDVEKDIIVQAIDCVKFFSVLKIKSMADSLEEFRIPDRLCLTQSQLTNYEHHLSSPFLCEMNFIQKKAKEILDQAKTFTTA